MAATASNERRKPLGTLILHPESKVRRHFLQCSKKLYMPGACGSFMQG
jgi:hypothetical protein